MRFAVGEKVVYPNHGVGVIEQVTQKLISGKPEEFYLLRIQATSSLVMVPISNVESVGLRKVIGKADVDQLFKLLRDGFNEPQADWKDRYKDNAEKMRSGSIYQVAEVLKNLVYLSYKKPLSFREKKMLERAKQLVVSEVAIVKNLPESMVESQIDKALAVAYERTNGQSRRFA